MKASWGFASPAANAELKRPVCRPDQPGIGSLASHCGLLRVFTRALHRLQPCNRRLAKLQWVPQWCCTPPPRSPFTSRI